MRYFNNPANFFSNLHSSASVGVQVYIFLVHTPGILASVVLQIMASSKTEWHLSIPLSHVPAPHRPDSFSFTSTYVRA